MSLWAVIIIAFGLAMDSIAVCIVAASAGYAADKRAVFRLAFHFGLFRFLMLVLGWTMGFVVEHCIAGMDHWVAFGLLAFVGGRMIWAAFHPSEQTQRRDPLRGLTMVMLSIATSLDALVVGIRLALSEIPFWSLRKCLENHKHHGCHL